MADKRTDSKRPERRRDSEFYESMPGFMDNYYYREYEDDADFERRRDDMPNQTEQMSRQAKTTAIITIVLTIIVAVAMALLFIKGIGVIKNMAPSTSGSSQSQTY